LPSSFVAATYFSCTPLSSRAVRISAFLSNLQLGTVFSKPQARWTRNKEMKGMDVKKKPYDWPLVRKEPPALIGEKCSDCGKLNFPPTPICTACLSGNVRELAFGEKGSLYSHTIVRVPMPGFDPPYAIGYVDIEGGVRLFTRILDWQDCRLESGVGMELVVTTSKLDSEGNSIFGFAYRPIKG
jgi:uncharacterized protein